MSNINFDNLRKEAERKRLLKIFEYLDCNQYIKHGLAELYEEVFVEEIQQKCFYTNIIYRTEEGNNKRINLKVHGKQLKQIVLDIIENQYHGKTRTAFTSEDISVIEAGFDNVQKRFPESRFDLVKLKFRTYAEKINNESEYALCCKLSDSQYKV
jgi:hypothetical protein